MNNEILTFIQNQIEYKFNEINLLRQAFTRKSYSEENKKSYHNEVLEFYGDKVLDFIVMKKLCEKYGKIKQNGEYLSQKSEGKLTDLKKKLVCKKMLAHRIDLLNIADFLLMGNGDKIQNTQDQESVKEDLFESIVGAVAIDCDWNTKTLEQVIEKMIDIEYYLENDFNDDKNYVDLVQIWCQKKYGYIPEYNYYEINGGYKCIINLSNEFYGFIGYGVSKRKARMEASHVVYEYLDDNNYLILPIDEIGEPNLDKAINQLQELYQKGYIGEPWYKFDETYDENGNPVWNCECHINGFENYYHGNYSSKKYGKKEVSYYMLLEILGMEENDEA